MSETIQQDPVEQRQEILIPFFKYIKGGESFYVVGGASMGKTRLLDFLMRQDVREHYLGQATEQTWLVRVDMNRLAIRGEAWAFYELLLSSIVLELLNHNAGEDLRNDLMALNTKVIKKKDPLLALRSFEMVVNQLCQGETGIKLCFLLDEFDETYRTLAPDTFSQLRAVRDANKYYVLYGVFLRDLPERLRPDPDNENFYELISRNMLGIGPYSKKDTLWIIEKLEGRRNQSPLTRDQREELYQASGGHIGLVQAFLTTMVEDRQAVTRIGTPGWMEWFGRQLVSREECRKIWEGLHADERAGLAMFLRGEFKQIPFATVKLLSVKGILLDPDKAPHIFSPVFEQYAREMS